MTPVPAVPTDQDKRMAEFAADCATELAEGMRRVVGEIASRLPLVDPSQRVFADGFSAGVQSCLDALDEAAKFARAAVSA